jgi:pimeloyl-ACP methyl ester carboxylesterase
MYGYLIFSGLYSLLPDFYMVMCGYWRCQLECQSVEKHCDKGDVMFIPAKHFLFIVSLCFWSNAVNAETVSLKTPGNILSTAEYHQGDQGKPLLIFIHGFLQTRSFTTVARLFDALHESGFPVLAPTLSLGVSNRAQSLPCESIHLHSLNSDTEEIDLWVEWAIAHGHREIVLIGHSAGSVNITAYLGGKIHPQVKKTILISLTYFGPDRAAAFETEAHAQKAREMLDSGDTGVERFALAFCKEYVSTAKDFLSYYEWSDKQVLKAINVGGSRNYIIIGSEDERIGQEWIAALQRERGKVIVIEGASHFFDQSHEFDLLDSVENIISGE